MPSGWFRFYVFNDAVMLEKAARVASGETCGAIVSNRARPNCPRPERRGNFIWPFGNTPLANLSNPHGKLGRNSIEQRHERYFSKEQRFLGETTCITRA